MSRLQMELEALLVRNGVSVTAAEVMETVERALQGGPQSVSALVEAIAEPMALPQVVVVNERAVGASLVQEIVSAFVRHGRLTIDGRSAGLTTAARGRD